MGRYYDVSEVVRQGKRIGKASEYRPHVAPDETLAGVAILTDGKQIWAIAPDLMQERNFQTYCVDKNPGYNLIRVELYRLNTAIAEKIGDGPAKIVTTDIIEFLEQQNTRRN